MNLTETTRRLRGRVPQVVPEERSRAERLRERLADLTPGVPAAFRPAEDSRASQLRERLAGLTPAPVTVDRETLMGWAPRVGFLLAGFLLGVLVGRALTGRGSGGEDEDRGGLAHAPRRARAEAATGQTSPS